MSVDWQAVRADYPGLPELAYLDTACKGLVSSGAARAIAQHVERLRRPTSTSTTEETIAMLDAFGDARRAVASLIGAQPDEIALTTSTESGLAVVADALRFERDSNVLASDLEFVGTVLPWKERGVDVRFVPHREGVISADAFEAAVDEGTRAVVLSAVQEVNGFCADLDAFADMCRRCEILLVVDGIQFVGPRRFDAAAVGVDVLAAGGHKWLCAPFGMGFTYVSRRIHDRLEPHAHAFMTALPPSGGWAGYLESEERHPADRLAFPTDARQLETGALGTTLAAAGLAAAVDALLAIGPDAVVERSKALAGHAADVLRDAGATIVTPGESTIVTFAVAGDLNRHRLLVDELAAARIVVSLRGTTAIRGIRASPYFYNDEADLERLAAVVRRLSRRWTATAPR